MKSSNSVTQALKKMISIALVFAMVFTFVNPVAAEAKSKVTLKPSGAVFAPEKVESVATKVGKGTHNIVLKKASKISYGGYVKFVAPESKNYSFTISNVKTNGKAKVAFGSVYGDIIDPVYPSMLKEASFKTNGGSNNKLMVGTKKYKNSYAKDKSEAYYLKKRTGKTYLEAGQAIYLQFSISAGGKCKSVSTKLVIK